MKNKFASLVLLTALICSGAWLWLGDEGRIQLFKALTHIGPGAWAVVLMLSLANYLIRFVRWNRVIRALSGVRLPWVEHLLCYLSGFAFTLTPGKAGEMARGIFLTRRGIPMDVTLSMFVYERVLDMMAILTLAGFAFWSFPRFQWLAWLSLGLIVAFFVFVAIVPTNAESRMARAILTRFKVGVSAISKFRLLLRFGPLLTGFLLGLVAWGLEGIGFYIILSAMGLDISPWIALGIYSLGIVAGALSFIPGGVGGTEAAMIACLTGLGVSLAIAIAATLVCRIATLWFAVALGVAALPSVAAQR